MTLKRDDYIKLVEEDYFGNVAQSNIDAILNCFTDDSSINIRHGDMPLRSFSKNPSASETALEDFYAHLCGNFNAWFGNFVHYVDAEIAHCSCTFTVQLKPLAESPYLDAGPQTLNNCNFFSYENGRIREMTIYYSNSEAGVLHARDSITPTGYPK